MRKKVKCFVCGTEFKCEEGSEMDKLGFCFLCFIRGSVAVVNLKGKIVDQKPIPEEKQKEMMKRVEKMLNSLSNEKSNDGDSSGT